MGQGMGSIFVIFRFKLMGPKKMSTANSSIIGKKWIFDVKNNTTAADFEKWKKLGEKSSLAWYRLLEICQKGRGPIPCRPSRNALNFFFFTGILRGFGPFFRNFDVFLVHFRKKKLQKSEKVPRVPGNRHRHMILLLCNFGGGVKFGGSVPGKFGGRNIWEG